MKGSSAVQSKIFAMYVFLMFLITHPYYSFAAKAVDTLSEEQKKISNTSVTTSTLQDDLVVMANYPDDGVVLGQGWDMVSGNKTNTICVNGVEKTIENDAATINYELLYDAEQLSKLLDISARAAYGGFGYSASIESTYKKINLTDRTRNHILGRVITDKGGSFLVASKNTPMDLIMPSNSAIFRKTCGDGYVSAIKKGGQLNLIFDTANQNDETSESIGLKMQAGGYGSNIGLSVSQESISKLIDQNTRISSIQTGGLQEFPISAEDVKSKISKFANFQTDKSVPYKIYITPYSRLNTPLTTNNISAINSYYYEYQRMLTLANLYNSSLIQKEMFYQPFYKDDKSVRLITDFLIQSTACMEIILSRCLNGNDSKNCVILNSKIDSNTIFNMCGLKNDNAALQTIILNRPNEMDSLVKDVVPLPIIGSVNLLNGVAVNNLKYDTPLNFLESQKEVLSDIDFMEWSALTPFDIYYMLYARAPLLKKVTGEQLENGDEVLSVFAFCENSKNGCKKAEAITTVQNNANKELVSRAILNWVLNIRLAPISSTFCNLSLQHYMCSDYKRLSFYLPREIYLGSENGFNYKINPPSNTIISPPTSPPRPRMPKECPPKLCR